MGLQSDREMAILSFWHKLEFFTPFDAKQKIVDAQDNDSYCSFSIDELKSLPQDQSIRHLLPSAPPGKQFGGASLYLNLFGTNKISQIIQEVLQEELSEHEQFSQEALGADDGTTCFAKLEILMDGTLDIQKIQLSTVPWALGVSAKHGLSALNINRFEQDCSILNDKLVQINQEYRVTTISETNKPIVQYILSPTVLLRLIDDLHRWAYSCPLIEPDTPVIGICLKWRDKCTKKQNNKHDKTKLDNANNGGDEEEVDDNDREWVADDIGILNSFYAKDIHGIIRRIEQGECNPALSAYLKMASDKKVDLYHDEGDWLIWQNLQPKYWNRGRWLSEPAHGLSLMQQFAVNTFFKEGMESPVFSVNGPPGTGKTTLLRDIFAENIVRRATVLAELDKASDAIATKNKEDGISTLQADLTGFEMVVVSSNNAAVENISRDLPKKSSLAKVYQAQDQSGFGYLEAIARNLVAKRGDTYKKLPEDQEIWGLFSCALGKRANRIKAKEGLFFVNKDDDNYDANLYQTIWQWRDNYQGITFKQAKQDFKDQKKLVEQKLDELQCLCELHEQVVLKNSSAALKHECDELGKRLEVAERNYTLALEQLKYIQDIDLSNIDVDDAFVQAVVQAKANQQVNQAAIETCQDLKIYWRHKLQALEHGKPSFFASLFQSQQYKDYQNNVAECHAQLAQLQMNESEGKKALQQSIGELHLASNRLHMEQKRLYQQKVEIAKSFFQEQEWQRDECKKQIGIIQTKLKELDCIQEKYQDILNKYPKVKLPDNLKALREDDFQIVGLWQDDELNDYRSCLFGKALQLHEAWLAEVSKPNCGFGGNISKLSQFLQGDIALNHEQALAMWQSLFMIIPVVSSTFASFANQFQDLDSGSLGYLFVDEAGQAVPQAAAGAMWRAKRAMVVGDPIQIEPVFTTPPPLVRHLETISGMPNGVTASPLSVSVQILADKYNQFGVSITQNGESTWIGSPLRVHRRCLEPMFGIANKIAYENKMILSETNPAKQWPSKEGLYLGESGWVQIIGQAGPRQFVQAQADVVIQMLIKIVNHTGRLPDLYIISPFKKIRNELIKQICVDSTLVAIKGLKSWCETRIGTVHTFQGKEEKMVWFVLGCDEDTDSAAQWAASKPNLLNVALTRAKRYIFVFGDKQIWESKPYFDCAIQHLPEIGSEDFLTQNLELAKNMDK